MNNDREFFFYKRLLEEEVLNSYLLEEEKRINELSSMLRNILIGAKKNRFNSLSERIKRFFKRE